MAVHREQTARLGDEQGGADQWSGVRGENCRDRTALARGACSRHGCATFPVRAQSRRQGRSLTAGNSSVTPKLRIDCWVSTPTCTTCATPAAAVPDKVRELIERLIYELC